MYGRTLTPLPLPLSPQMRGAPLCPLLGSASPGRCLCGCSQGGKERTEGRRRPDCSAPRALAVALVSSHAIRAARMHRNRRWRRRRGHGHGLGAGGPCSCCRAASGAGGGGGGVVYGERVAGAPVISRGRTYLCSPLSVLFSFCSVLASPRAPDSTHPTPRAERSTSLAWLPPQHQALAFA